MSSIDRELAHVQHAIKARTRALAHALARVASAIRIRRARSRWPDDAVPRGQDCIIVHIAWIRIAWAVGCCRVCVPTLPPPRPCRAALTKARLVTQGAQGRDVCTQCCDICCVCGQEQSPRARLDYDEPEPDETEAPHHRDRPEAVHPMV